MRLSKTSVAIVLALVLVVTSCAPEKETEPRSSTGAGTDPIHIAPTDDTVVWSVGSNAEPGAPNVIREDFATVMRVAEATFDTTKKTGLQSNMSIDYKLDDGTRVFVLVVKGRAVIVINGKPVWETCKFGSVAAPEVACQGNGIPANVQGASSGAFLVQYPKGGTNETIEDPDQVTLAESTDVASQSKTEFDQDPIHIDPDNNTIAFDVSGTTTPGAQNVIRDDFSGVTRTGEAIYDNSKKSTGPQMNMSIGYKLASGPEVLVLVVAGNASMTIGGTPVWATCDHELSAGDEGACEGNGMPSNAAGTYDDDVTVTYPKGGLTKVIQNPDLVKLKH